MAEDLQIRFDALFTGVVAPLVLGGRVEPVRPFGPRLALAIGEGRTISDSDLRSRVNVARVRVARLVAPVDTVPDISPEEFALAAGLNDLLQVSNLELSGPFTRKRHTELLAHVGDLVSFVSGPQTIAEALSRHTVFSRALEVIRTDTTVSWWTGSASFRGTPPSGRLLLWKDLRRVREDTQRIPLVEMTADVTALPEGMWDDVLRKWLAASPLTDIATATRRSPTFRWSNTTLSLISCVPGRTLAFRALCRQRAADAAGVIERAAQALPDAAPETKELVQGFAKELADGMNSFTKKSV